MSMFEEDDGEGPTPTSHADKTRSTFNLQKRDSAKKYPTKIVTGKTRSGRALYQDSVKMRPSLRDNYDRTQYRSYLQRKSPSPTLPSSGK